MPETSPPATAPPPLPGERVLCRFYLLSTDLVHTQNACEWIVQRARRRHLAGATLLQGIYGFGSRGITQSSLWHVSNPRPAIVELIDDGQRLMNFVREEVFPHLHHGTLTLERAAVLMYRRRADAPPTAPLDLHQRIQDLSTLPPPLTLSGSTPMLTNTDGVLLRIFAGESDLHDGRPLYEALVGKARELGLAGATVLRGAMGFGANSVLHTSKLVEFSTDLPIVIELVDREEKIQQLLPHVQEMVKEGLVTMESVRILAYRHNPADAPS